MDQVLEGAFNKVEEIHEFLDVMKTKNEETLYVGDMVHDIETAKAAGLDVVAVTYGYDSLEKLKPHKPTYIINNLNELKELDLF